MTIYASCAVLLEESVSAMINPLTPTNTTLQLAVTMGDYPRSNIVCCRGSSIFEKIINSSIFGDLHYPRTRKIPMTREKPWVHCACSLLVVGKKEALENQHILQQSGIFDGPK